MTETLPLTGQTVLLVSPSGWPLPHFRYGVETLGGCIERFLLSYSMGRPDWSDHRKSNALRNHQLREMVKAMSPKPIMAIFMVYDDCVEAETIKYLKSLGIYTVSFHVDMVGQWYRVLRTGRFYDRFFCAQKINMDSLKAYGVRTEFLPMATYPRQVESVEKVEKVVCYVGSPQNYRVWMLEKLSEKVPLRCYGHWFDEVKPEVSSFVPDPMLVQREMGFRSRVAKFFFDTGYFRAIAEHSPYVLTQKLPWGRPGFRGEKQRLRAFWGGRVPEDKWYWPFASSQVNIGFTYYCGNPGTASEIRQCRLREFDGPLYGANGPYLMQDFPELDDLYKRNDEVVVWNSFEELASKSRELLADPKTCRELAQKAQNAVMKRHLWSHRLMEMLSYRGKS